MLKGVDAQVVLCLQGGLINLHRLVIIPEQPINHHTNDQRSNTQSRIHVQQQGILGQWQERKSKQGTDTVCEEEHGHHNRLHGSGGVCEGEFETGDGGKDLRDGDEEVGEDLPGDRDIVGGLVLVAEGAFVVGAGDVDFVLDDCCPGHGEGAEEKAEGDADDGLELPAHATETGVDDLIENRDEDDQDDGINVVDDVVGDSVEEHGSGLGGQVGSDLVVDHPVEGEEQED